MALTVVGGFASDALAHQRGSSMRSYTAPFRLGPSGGDRFSYHSAGRDGTVTVVRAYPAASAINCGQGAPYAKLLVRHEATAPVRRVVVSYSDAAVDPYTFVTVGLRERSDTDGRWYGTAVRRGAVTGDGRIVLHPDRQSGDFPRTLVVEFGLQQSGACPSADGGTIRFTRVQVGP